MSVRPRSWTASACLLLALVCGGCGDSPNKSPEKLTGPGPLAGQNARSLFAQATEPGHTFTDGTALIDIPGDIKATIVKVESIGGEQAARFLGAKLVSPRREYTTSIQFDGWPPTDLKAEWVSEAEGAVVDPTVKTWHTQAYELLLGYRIESDEYAVRTGIRVTYRIGERLYRATIPSAIAFCPTEQDLDACRDRAYESMD